jgi:transcriptional regulator with XRE-family HTH domain
MSLIGERLKQARESIDLDQDTFGKSIGVGGRPTISRWERGLAFPPADILAAIHEKYGINIHWLLTGNGSMSDQGPECHTTKAIESDILRQIIREVEDGLVSKASVIDPDKKARLITLLYDYAIRTGQAVERETIQKYLDLVT